jgi:uncharacterized repeat protein (TIGR01451 family)
MLKNESFRRILYFTVLLFFVFGGTLALLNYSGVFAGDNVYNETFGSLTHSGTVYSAGSAKLETIVWADIDGSTGPGQVSAATDWRYTDMVLDSNDRPVVAAIDNITFDLYFTRWNGTAWTQADSATAGVETIEAASFASQVQILIDGSDNIHLVWWDGSDVHVKYWNGAAWGNLGASTNVTNQLGMAGVSFPADYAYLDGSDYINLAFTNWNVWGVYFTKWDGTKWAKADGTAGSDNVAAVISTPFFVLDNNNRPYVGWTAGGATKFRKWTGAAWTDMAGADADETVFAVAGGISILINSLNNPVVVGDDGAADNLFVSKWDGAKWAKMDGTAGNDSISTVTNTRNVRLVLLSDNPYIMWEEDDGIAMPYENINLTRWDGAQWSQMDGTAGTENLGAAIAGSPDFASSRLEFDSANNAHIFFANTEVAAEGGYYAQWDSVDSRWEDADGTAGISTVGSTNNDATEGILAISTTDVPHVLMITGDFPAGTPYYAYYSGLYASSGTVTLATNANSGGNTVLSATLTGTHNATGGTIAYALSTNEGLSWDTVTSGTAYSFVEKGDELLWRTTITSDDGSATPTISGISITYNTNSAPGTPTLSSPADAAASVSANPTFQFSSSDTDSDELWYVLEIGMTDDLLNNIWVFDQRKDNQGWSSSIYAAGATASFTLPGEISFDESKTYYWRTRAYDVNGLMSSVSAINSFTVDINSVYEYITNFLTMEDIDVDNSDFFANYGKNKVAKLPVTNTFAAAVGAVGSSNTQKLYVMDANGDEIPDILELTDAGAVFHSNDGAATFTANVVACGSYDAVIFDADNDGDLDYASGYNDLYLCINDGAGAFTASASLGSMSSYDGIRGADINNDGYLDVTNGEKIFLNDGTSTLALSATTFGTGISSNDKFEMFDIDNDGDDDLVYIDWLPNQSGRRDFKTYLNDGSGVFTASQDLYIGANEDPVVTDFDLDGDKDLIFQPEVSGTMTALINNGSGTFSLLNNIVTGDNCIDTAWQVADLDGDGFEELICGSADGTQNYIYRHPGLYSFTYAWHGQVEYDEEAAFGTYHGADFVVADFDKDGDSDVVLGANGQNYYYANTANSYSSSNLTAGESVLAVFDSDNDGDMDLYVNNNGGANELWVNDGALSYTQTASFGSVNAYAVAVGDVDNDGDLDIAEVGYGGANLVYLNNGSNSFTGKALGVGTDNSIDIKFADAENDGDLDVFVANVGAKDELYLNNGSGTFSAVTNPFGTNTYDTGKFDVGDVDGDGDVDVVFPYVDGAVQGAVFTNNGSGTFTGVDTFAVASYVIRLGDLDNDGDLDAVLADNASGAKGNYVYYNNGTGTFTQHIDFSDGSDTRDIHLADADLDGDLDIFFANGNAATEADILYLNHGNLNFAYTTIGAAAKSESIVTGDYDSDGDLDFYANYPSVAVSRQFEQAHTYTTGTDYEIITNDVYTDSAALSFITLDKTDYTPTGTTIAYTVQDTADSSYTFAQEDTTGRGVDANTGEVGAGVSFVLGDSGNNALKTGGVWADLSVSEGTSDLMDYWSGDVGGTTYIISVGSDGYFTAVSADLLTQEALCGGVVGVGTDLTEMAIDSTELIIYASGSGGVGVKVDLTLADAPPFDITDATCEIVNFGAFATAEDLNTVWQSADGTAIVFGGDNGTVIASTDSGATWGTINVGTSENINHIEMSNTWFTLVGDNGLIIKSSDAGVTWSQLCAGSTTENLNWIRNESNARFLAVGDNDTYIHTEDSGASCTVGTTGVAGAGSLNSIDDDELYVYGDNDIIYNFTYNAGGTSFVSLTPGSTYTFNAGTDVIKIKATMSTTDANKSPYISDLSLNYVNTGGSSHRSLPNPPSNLDGTAQDPYSILWDWDYVDNDTGSDKFEFWLEEEGAEEPVADNLTDRNYEEGELTPNTGYRRVVYSKNEMGRAEPAATLVDGLYIYTFAEVPSIISHEQLTDNAISLQIDEQSNPDYTKYALWSLSEGEIGWLQADNTLGVEPVYQAYSDWGDGGMVVDGLALDQLYIFKLKAINEDDSETTLSPAYNVTLASLPVGDPAFTLAKVAAVDAGGFEVSSISFGKDVYAANDNLHLMNAIKSTSDWTDKFLVGLALILLIILVSIIVNGSEKLLIRLRYVPKMIFSDFRSRKSGDVYKLINNIDEPTDSGRYKAHSKFYKFFRVLMAGFWGGIALKALAGIAFMALLYLNIGYDVTATGDAQPGDIITYTITYKNVGEGNATGVVITDNIPSYTQYSSGSLRANGLAQTDVLDSDFGSYSSGVVTFNLGDVAIGDSGKVLFKVTVTGNPKQVISNVSSINYEETSTLTYSNTVTNTIAGSAGVPACSDKIDNDSDGLIDYPTDPGCTGLDDESEINVTLTQCSDNLDNDLDGLIDLYDPGCSGASDDDEINVLVTQCGDGLDNDSDGKTDYPNDPGCLNAADNSEVDQPVVTHCSDGIDNDGDGLIDYPNDPGCSSAGDGDESDTMIYQCADGIDNDNDGFIDLLDPGCENETDNDEVNLGVTQCSDGIDNDLDGLIDYPFDPGCVSPQYDDELNIKATHCSDGIDNDNDNLVDLADPGCSDAADDDEENELLTACSDGLDNDADGLIDMSDPGCTTASDDDEFNVVLSQCSDGVDNDNDGKVDLFDPGCDGSSDNDETDHGLTQCGDSLDNDSDQYIDYPTDPGCVAAGDDDELNSTLTQCSDFIDNDLDGLIDYPNDPGCQNAADNTEVDADFIYACLDGLDNDEDGLIDYPFDPGCYGASDDSEIDMFETGLACSDLFDNDGDGLIDFPEDPGCLSASDYDEEDYSIAVYPQCNDSLDNDSDGFIDYPNDPDCDSLDDDNESTSGGGITILPQCSDGIDNDGDSLIDYPNDPDCDSYVDETESPNVIIGRRAQCNDYRDNDNDGAIDLADIDCESIADNSEDSCTNNALIVSIREKEIWERTADEREYEKLCSVEELTGGISSVIGTNNKEVKKVVRRVAKTVKDVQRSTIDNPVLEKINAVVKSEIITATAIASIASVATVGMTSATGAGVLSYLNFIFMQPMLVLFARRRKQTWGTVYNSVTKRSVDLAVVRVYNAESNRLVRTKVTDAQGRYQFILKPGKYYLSVDKKGFKYPSTILRGTEVDGKYHNVYYGDTFEVTKENTAVVSPIAIDPSHDKKPVSTIVRLYFIRRGQQVLTLAGPIVAVASFVINPAAWVGGTALAHIGLYIIFNKLAFSAKPKSYGVVRDSKTRDRLGLTVLRVFDTKYNKLLDSQVTDSFGRYAFLVGNSSYYVTAEKAGYYPKRTQIINLEHELSGYLVEDLFLHHHGLGENVEQAQKEGAPVTMRSNLGREEEKLVDGKQKQTRRHAEKHEGDIEGVDLDDLHEDLYKVDSVELKKDDTTDTDLHTDDNNETEIKN